MGMKHCWNYTDRGELKNSKITLSQCHFVHYKLYMDGPGICSEMPATYHLHHDIAISYDPLLKKSFWHMNEAGEAQLIN